jgi:DNA-binding NarL/FixJ family response regulator
MGRVSVGVLLVDDFKPLREWVSALLKSKLGFEILSEASDGVQAVQKAAELNPELIILDIGLPNMNGIEAARQIRTVSPASEIVFLTVDESPAIVRAALGAGAKGYVSKWDGSNELLLAIDAALEGRQYVSRRLAGQYLYDTYGEIDQTAS